MIGRAIAIVSGLVVLFAGLYLLLGSPGESIDPAEPEHRSLPQGGTSSGSKARSAEGAVPIASDRFVDDEQPSTKPTTQPVEPLNVRGIIIVRTADGQDLPAQDGTLTIQFLDKDWGDEIEVAVTDGRWACTVESCSALQVISCVLDERPVYFPDEQAYVDRPADDVVTLRGVRGASFTLRVLDAGTGADLQGVSLYRNVRWNAWDSGHPWDLGEVVPILRDAGSPMEVVAPPRLGRPQVKCWVIAPGFAWGKLGVDHTAGGERAVRLHDGGTLEVQVGEKGRGANTWCRLRPIQPGGGGDVIVPADGSGKTTIEGVRVGAFELTLEKGKWLSDRVRLGSAKVVVRKGETTTVEVDTAEAPVGPPAVMVSGTLTLPSSWPREGVVLHLLPKRETEAWGSRVSVELSSMQAVNGSSERFAWSIEDVVAGTYSAVVGPIGTNRSLTVSDAGESNVEVVVPDAAEVEVVVQDAITGIPLEAQRVELRVMSSVPGKGGFSRIRPDASGRFRLLVPVGDRVTLSADAEDYDWSVTDHVFSAGVNAIDVKLSPVSGISFVLKDGEATVPFNFDWVEMEEVGGEGRSQTRSPRGISVTHSGTYRVTFKRIPGFKPVVPRDVFVPPGTWVTHTVTLER